MFGVGPLTQMVSPRLDERTEHEPRTVNQER